MTSDLPPPHPEDVPRSADPRQPSPRSSPNYTARRVAVGAVIVALVAVAAAAILTRLGGDGDTTADGIEPTWNAVVEIERAGGEIVILDDGDEVARIDGNAGRVTDLHVRGDRLALVSRDQVTVTSLTDDSVGDGEVVPVAAGAVVTRVPSNRSLTLVAAPAAGGNVVVIDGVTGATLDIGETVGTASPLLLPDTFRADPAGTRFAVGDGRNFQTIVAGFDDDEATFYPGVPLALDDGLVVTSLIVGNSAELRLFAPGNDDSSVVATERPVGGVVAGNRFVYVTEQGAVQAATFGSSDVDQLADVDMSGIDWVAPALDGDRLVVAGAGRLVVIELDGSIVHISDTDGTGVRPWATWRCLPVIDPDEGGRIIDLRTGDAVADLAPGTISSVSTDGCGVHLTHDDGDTVTSTAGSVTLSDDVRSVVLAPDGSAALVTASDGSTELVDVADRRRLDIGERRGFLAFVDR